MSKTYGWIGVDLDGTLAHYDGWISVDHIGEPIPEMLARVMKWLDEGIEVRILTARCACDEDELEEVISHIHEWCKKHIGQPLIVTCQKDMRMIECWDDRAVAVERNTGRILGRNE